MAVSIVLLLVPGSSLGNVMHPRMEARGVECRVLDLDAPLGGKPVTIGPRRVIWEGVDLLSAGALLVECPVFPWPQPLRTAGLPSDEDDRAAAIAAEREARSLAVSAIRVAAESIPVVNPPWTAHLAAAPAMALDLASRAGVPVASWRLGPMRIATGDDLILDPVGRERSHTPSRPQEGDPALAVHVPAGPLLSMLVVGGSVVGVLGHENARSWAAGESQGEEPVRNPDPALVDTALRAAEACSLPLAEILLGSDPTSRVAFINPAPELTAWGARTEGRALDALADHLIGRARRGVPAAPAAEARP